MTGADVHVLVIGIDGVRFDTLEEVQTPAIDAIAERGFLQSIRVNDAGPTISGPSWSTITTGVLAPVHQIWNNEISPNNLAANPDFIHLARTTLGASTFVAGAWPPLVSDSHGGPILADGGLLPGGAHPSGVDGWHTADQAVTDAAVSFLSDQQQVPTASFVYLGGCDAVAHDLGVAEDYRDFIAASDRRVGEVIAAVEARPDRAAEDWLVIVVTDHGHRDEGGHGGDSDLERTAWIAACGSGVPSTGSGSETSDTGSGTPGAGSGTPTVILEQADVAGHVFSVLGLEPRGTDFVGLPFGSRTEAA